MTWQRDDAGILILIATHDGRRVTANLVTDVREALTELRHEAIELLGELAELRVCAGSRGGGGGGGGGSAAGGDARLLFQGRDTSIELREERGEGGHGGGHF